MGQCTVRCAALGAGCILLPMDADVAAAAALRSFLGWGCTAGGYFFTPAAGPDSHAAGTLCTVAGCCCCPAGVAGPGSGCGGAVVECAAEELSRCTCGRGSLAGYPPAGQSGTLFSAAGRVPWAESAAGRLPLADRVHIAILLARGYAALESRESPQGTVLALYPV